MKKLIIFYLVIMVVLTACSSEPSKNSKGSQLEDFKNYIQKSESPLDVKEYLDQLIEVAETETAGALVSEYLNYMEDLIFNGFSGYEERLAKLNDAYNTDTGVIDEDSIQGEDIKKFYTTFKEAGFRFVSVEGFLSPIIDYHFIEAYSEHVSPEISDFASFMSLESDEPWAMDGGITISLKDLADRIALAEQYLTTYPNSTVKEKVLRQYNYYFKAFLGGLDNTPLVMYDTSQINAEFLAAFDYFIEIYPDLITTETIKSFQNELKETNFLAPYTYNEDDKRTAFMSHIDTLVINTRNKF